MGGAVLSGRRRAAHERVLPAGAAHVLTKSPTKSGTSTAEEHRPLTNPETKFPPQRAESTPQTGGDETLSLMHKARIPVTRENYLQVAYLGQIPQPWTAELELELPEELRDSKVLSGKSAPSKEEIPAEWREIQRRHKLTDKELEYWMDVT
jgi:hypothetical protein